MTIPYTEALERALGRVIAETRAECARQIELATARADTVIARLEARNTELESRAADNDRIIREQVEAGIKAGIAEIEERCRPDDGPLQAVVERLAEVESRGAEVESLVARVAEVEAREFPDVVGIAREMVDEAIAGLPDPVDLKPLRVEIDEVRASIPDPVEVPDVSEFATRDDLAEVRSSIPEIPKPVNLSGFATKADIAEITAFIPSFVRSSDLSVFATRDELAKVRAAIPEVPEVPEPKDWTDEIAATRSEVNQAVQLVKNEADQVMVEVRERLARHPGNFPVLKGWADGVHYAGDVVVHDGATWQARRDTGKSPPHDDWSCIAAKGEKGSRGASFTVRGTYSAEETYSALDVVMLDGSSFVAKQDDPGECPGDGWQLAASRGSRGKPGDSVKGNPGKAGEPVVAADVSDDGVLTLTNGDGTTVEVDLYPLLAKVAK